MVTYSSVRKAAYQGDMYILRAEEYDTTLVN